MNHLLYLRTVGRLVSTAAQVEERNQVRAAAGVLGWWLAQ